MEHRHRGHYHAILFNLPPNYIAKPKIIESIWQHGIVDIGEVTERSIAYVAGYVNKQKYFTNPDDPEDDRHPEFSRMSKHLGANFLTPEMVRHIKKKLSPTIKVHGGIELSLPQYYRNFKRTLFDAEGKKIGSEHMFNQEERWLISLKSKDFISENPYFPEYVDKFGKKWPIPKEKNDIIVDKEYQRKRKTTVTRNKV